MVVGAASRRSDTRLLGIALCVLALLLLPRLGSAARLEVTLEPATVRTGDPMVLSVEIWGEDLGFSAPETRLELDNLEAVAGPSVSRRTRFEAGVSVRSFLLIWRLNAGDIGYGSATATALFGRRRLESPPRRAHIVAPDLAPPTSARILAKAPTLPGALPPPVQPPPPLTAVPGPAPPQRGNGVEGSAKAPTDRPGSDPPPPRDAVRLVAEVQPQQAWVGEPVTYTLYLDYLTDVRSIRPTALPAFSGFWVRDVSVAQRSPRALRGSGRSYLRRALLERVLFPLEAGILNIDAADASMVVILPDGGQPVNRRSLPLTVEVRPLPEPTPEGFTGAVGQLRLDLEVQPSQLSLGSADEVVATLRGRGYLETVVDPQFAAPSQGALHLVERRAPAAVAKRADEAARSERSWRWTLIPERPGKLTLPELSIPYFDPENGRYRLARAQLPPLSVDDSRPSAGETPSSSTDRPRVENFGALGGAASSQRNAPPADKRLDRDRLRSDGLDRGGVESEELERGTPGEAGRSTGSQRQGAGCWSYGNSILLLFVALLILLELTIGKGRRRKSRNGKPSGGEPPSTEAGP
ncbi:MAG: hypothetical protein AAGD01_19780 [Acidobacteriota bacterium]